MQFVIYLFLLRISFSYGECSSKESLLGKCKPFFECPYLIELAKSISVYALVRQYGGCGRRNDNFLLCCPDKTPSETIPSTPQPSIVTKIVQLFDATHMGNLSKVEDLLKDGVKADVLIGGYTALMEVASKDHIAVLDALLNAKPDLNIQSPDGFTALMIAAEYGKDSVVEKLINAGADAGIKTADGNTALMVAAKNGRNSVIERLIRAGGDVNVQNSQGESALHFAAQNGHLPVVKSLLNAGADVGLKTNEGKTATEAAVQKQHFDVADLIQASGSA